MFYDYSKRITNYTIINYRQIQYPLQLVHVFL